jgi:hypothetical protein
MKPPSCSSYGSGAPPLQVDAHTRFLKDWDISLIHQWNLANDQKAIISTLPRIFQYRPDGSEHFEECLLPCLLHINEFYMGKIPTIHGIRNLNPHPTRLYKAAFVVGGFIFAPGNICDKVPYISEIAFLGEEIIKSLQFYTHGYNVYLPNYVPLFHLYQTRKRYYSYFE